VQLCPACGEENPARFRLCGICGAPLRRQVATQEVRKVVTVVFSDLKGSTSLGEKLDPESLREVMARYFDTFQEVLTGHGGTVEKFIGDAVMAVFGLARLHEDDALRAVRAAAEMRARLEVLNDELEARYGIRLTNRTGVNSGEVVAGDPGAGQRLVTGDPVNVAARLEQAAPDLEVLIGEATFRLVREAVEVEPVPPLELKGKSERIPAYRLLAVRSNEAIVRKLDAPMVGRAGELDQLIETFEVALSDRRCRVVTVVGHAGIGKSRLIAEFIGAVDERATVLRGRCLPYGDGITFWPLAEAMREAASITQEDSPATASAKLRALDADDAGEASARVAAAIGLSTASFSIHETFWATRTLFETLAGRRPLVVVFEDIHWAESTFLDLIDHIAATASGAPMVIVCSARPELMEGHPTWPDSQSNGLLIDIGALSEADSNLVVENQLGASGLPRDVRARITGAAEGNPLFLEQMLSMLIDDGRLVQDEGGRWSVAGDVTTVEVPPTISALLAARLDQLAEDERIVLERGSVVGQVFYRGAVEEMVPEEIRESVGLDLLTLGRKELIEPSTEVFAGEETFRFLHILIRDSAYHRLLKRTRSDLHERFALWLERIAGARLLEYEEIVGYHFEQAFRYLSDLGPVDERGLALARRAAGLLEAAGKRAFEQGDMPAAASLLERSAGLLPPEDPAGLALLPDLGEALLDLGEFARAELHLERATAVADRLGDPRLKAHAEIVRLLVRFVTDPEGWSGRVLAEAERAIPVLEEVDDQAGLAKAWRLLGSVHATACQYEAAEQAIQRSIDHARLAGDRRQEMRNLPMYALSALYGPMPVPEAIERCEQVLALTAGERRAEGIVRCALAHLNAMLGRFAEAREFYGRARSTFEEAGGKVLAASTSLDSGRVELLAGDPAAAEAELLPDYETLNRMGEKYLLSTLSALLSEAAYLQNDLDRADRYCRISEENSADDDVESQVMWRAMRGKLWARAGSHAEAETVLRDAIQRSESSDSPIMRANAMRDLAEVLQLAGQSLAADDLLSSALELYERKGDVVSVGRARLARSGIAPGLAR
jgi:class 3 adenylate cyclase/tetratricopeptide (TPR) repeat protein